jgi:hypothetical protein
VEKTEDGKRIFVSYLSLRRIVGTLGVLLPVLLALGCFMFGACNELQESISDYYDTIMRNVFVGVLFVIGWFMFAYRGYEQTDDVAGHLACAFSLGVALFPPNSASRTIQILHYVSAAALFLVLSYFSLYLFTKTSDEVAPTPRKLIRNKIYQTCGAIMLASIAAIALYHAFLQHTSIAAIKPVFWLESLALWAFGWSWFLKGETMLRDTWTGSA